MNRLVAPLLALVPFSAAAAPAAARADHKLIQLGSMQLVVVEDDSLGTVEGQLALRAGSVHEPADAKGVAALLGRAAALDLADWFASAGGSVTSRVDLDALRLDFSCPVEKLGEALGELEDRLSSAEHAEAVVASARDALVAEARARRATADGILELAAERLMLGPFPQYRRTLDPDSLAGLDAADVAAYHHAHVGANRLVVGIASPLAPDAVSEAVSGAFGALAEVGDAPPDPVMPILTPWRTRIYLIDDPDAERTELRILSPGSTRHADAAAPIEAWTWIVGKGPDSPLEEYVVGRGLADEVGIEFDPDWNRIGFFRGSISAGNETVGRALQSYMDLVSNYHGSPLKGAVRDEGVARFKANEEALLADPRVRMERGLDAAFHGYPKNYFDLRAAVAEVANAGLLRGAVQRQVLMKCFVIVALGPADEIREDLAYFADVIDHDLVDPVSSPEAQERVDALLAAMGGREAWATLKGAALETEVEVLQSGEMRTRKAKVWRHFDSAFSLTEQELVIQDVATAVDGTPGWFRGPLGIRGLANSQYRNQVRKSRNWLYCLLHRLAVRESGLVASLDDEGRLVLTDRLEEVCWIELGPNSRPTRMGWTEGIEYVNVFSSWAKSGDYVYAKEMALPYDIQGNELVAPQTTTRFEPNPPLDRSRYERPDRGI